MSEFDEIRNTLVRFRDARGWAKYHTPRNLAESVSIEAAELLELFQWGRRPDPQQLADELADVVIYCISLADVSGIRLGDAVRDKIRRNHERFPVADCK
jgi:NTP pyrophosphatase (non-canonical NTP hydrolase)